MKTLSEHSANHIRECYEFYRAHAPVKHGWLLNINDHHGNLYAIGKCVGVYCNKHDEWIVQAEIMEPEGLCIGEFYASQCEKHVGFWPEVV